MVKRLLLLLGMSVAAAAHEHAAPGEGVRAFDLYAVGDGLHLLVAVGKAHQEQVELLYQCGPEQKGVRVDAGLPAAFGARHGMEPQLVVAGERLLAVWTSAGTDAWGSGPMVTALSADGGKTWRQGPNPADDGLTTGHGFIDVAADATGTFHLTWLDSRDGAQGLRYATSRDGGATWSRNVTVKPNTCECCWNRVALNDNGAVALLFRDKNPRDMAVAYAVAGTAQWTAPETAGAFGWEFDGCPHVGGGLVFGTAGLLHSVVWTGKEKEGGVFYVNSPGQGKAWSAPHRLAPSGASHPDIARNSVGQLVAVWDSDTGIRGAISSDEGRTWTDARLKGAPAVFPRVAATSQGFVVVAAAHPAGKPAVLQTLPFHQAP